MKIPKKSTVLCGLGCLGVIGTGITTFIATRKSEKTLNDETLTQKEKIIKVLPKFSIPAVVAIGSITCIITNNYQNRKQIRTLAAAYMSMAELFNSYRREVIKEKGEDFDEQCYTAALKNTNYPNVRTDEVILLKDNHDGDIIETTLFDVEHAKRVCIEYYTDRENGERLNQNEYRWMFGFDWKPEYEDYGWCVENGVCPIKFKPDIYDEEQGVYILDTYEAPRALPPDIH